MILPEHNPYGPYIRGGNPIAATAALPAVVGGLAWEVPAAIAALGTLGYATYRLVDQATQSSSSAQQSSTVATQQEAQLATQVQGLRVVTDRIAANVTALRNELATTREGLEQYINLRYAILANQGLVHRTVLSGEISTQSDRVLGALDAQGGVITRNIDNVGAQVIGRIDQAQAGIGKDVIDQGEATRAAVDPIGQEVAGIGMAGPGLAAACGSGVLSMAGAGALVNTLSSTLSSGIHQGRIKCMPTTGTALLGQLLTSAMPAMLPLAYKLSPQFRGMVGGIVNEAWDMFLSPLEDMAPISPEEAPAIGATLFSNAMIAGVSAHMAAQTAEALAPLKHMGLSQLAAFLADMGSFSRIAAATLGVAITVGLRRPFEYNMNYKLRSSLLSPRDFFELLSRNAFVKSDVLRCPELNQTLRQVAPRGGAAFEQSMIGYFGYPSEYIGFFKEIANDPLRYFALAGVARTGYWDEGWFKEELARSSYSDTGQLRLLEMMHFQALDALTSLPYYQLRRLCRDGFITMDELKERYERAKEVPDKERAMLLAMEYEREYNLKDMTLDILDMSYTRGILKDYEYREELIKLGMSPDIADLHLIRARLGLMRKIKLEAPPAPTPILEIEEYAT